jgi:ribosomal protein S18 acetylase RimI-like enzyme
MHEWALRSATADDEDRAFLEAMVLEAASWRPGAARLAHADMLAEPGLAIYVAGWGRPGDAGVVAERNGQRVGAAWYRRFSDTAHGYGFLDAAIPELAIAVDPSWRGRGVGSSLLDALVAQARADGHTALSLSVEVDNPARRLYERAGFTRVGQVGNAWTMRIGIATRT